MTAVFFAQKYLPPVLTANPLAWLGLITAIVVLVQPAAESFFAWLISHVLFPERSRLPVFLAHLSQELSAASDLAEQANLLVNTLGEVCQFRTVSLLVREPEGQRFTVLSAYGWPVTDYRRVHLESGNSLLELMKAGRSQILIRERAIRSLSWQESNEVVRQFENLRASTIIPLWVKSHLIGSINLLAPTSGQEIDEQDERLLMQFAEKLAPDLWKTVSLQRLKQMNEALQDSRSRLMHQAKLTAIEQLATGIAHEIHNPLTIISGKAQVLLLQKDRKVYDEKVEEVLKTVVKQTRRAADITKKLLMFSRASASSREKLKLATVLEDTIALIAYQTSLEGKEIQRLVSENLPEFNGNTQEIREIFLNLILNAVQATGTGGRIQVEIAYLKKDKVFTLRVADNGPGISEENLAKLFDPFFTTRHEGVGLGLFITQQIVHRYGGSIRAESELGEGTLVVIELPEGSSTSPQTEVFKDSQEKQDTLSGHNTGTTIIHRS